MSILSKLKPPLGKPQCLVLEPTRELAHQVAEAFEHYGKHKHQPEQCYQCPQQQQQQKQLHQQQQQY